MEAMVSASQEDLRQSGNVYTFLRGRVMEFGVGEGIVHMLEGNEVSRNAVHSDWSVSWEGWARLVVELSSVLAANRPDAVEVAFGCVSETVRRFLVLAESAVNVPVAFPTDVARVEQLRAEGWELRKGEVWAREDGLPRGDCLADSLLQLLIVHGILPEALNANFAVGRDMACAAVRAHLCQHADADLRPRNPAGVEDPEAYLEHYRHAAEILSFFLARFERRRLRDLPEGGVTLLVKTRYDSLPGYVVSQTVCAGRAGAVPGGPLEFALFNWTGGGCTGYHYDLLVRSAGVVVELDGGDGGDGAMSSTVSGGGLVEQPRWAPFTPEGIDASLCRARVWRGGLGGQCDKKPEQGGDLCKSHLRSQAHGLVTGDIPEGKFREFQKAQARRRGSSGEGAAADSAEGQGVASGKRGAGSGAQQEGTVKRVKAREAAEARADAAVARAEAEEQRGIGDLQRARQMAARSQAREDLEWKEKRGR